MKDAGSITLLLQRLSEADESSWEISAAAIYERYCERLLAFARVQLSAKVRQRVDESDIAQQVFSSLFLKARKGQLTIRDRDNLWLLLVAITVKKVRETMAYHARKKRLVDREVSLDKDNENSRFDLIDFICHLEPNAEDAIELTEGLEKRLRILGDGKLAEIAILKLEGYTNDEIAARIQRNLRTVERKIELIRKKWENYQPDDS